MKKRSGLAFLILAAGVNLLSGQEAKKRRLLRFQFI